MKFENRSISIGGDESRLGFFGGITGVGRSVLSFFAMNLRDGDSSRRRDDCDAAVSNLRLLLSNCDLSLPVDFLALRGFGVVALLASGENSKRAGPFLAEEQPRWKVELTFFL